MLALKTLLESRKSWLALLAAAIVLAVLLGSDTTAPTGVGAHPCDANLDPPDIHNDFLGVPCSEGGHDDPHENIIEVDGGRDRELELLVYPPGDRTTYVSDGGRIEISLPEFDLTGVELDTLPSKIKLDDSGDGTEVSPTDASVSEEILTLTLPANNDLADVAGEFLRIRIEKGTGILTPETPSGFDEESEGYLVGITFLGNPGTADDVLTKDRNIVVVRNPVNSTVPGATVRLELESYANVEIGSNEEIVLDFSGPSEDASFDIPTTIDKTRFKIRSAETFDPADVLVQRDRVTLTVPEDKVVTGMHDFSISISQLARIKNPIAAGNRVITISSFVPHYERDEIRAVIRRTTTVSPSEGPRGSQFTLEGKGHAQGTVTVFEADADENEQTALIEAGETLASVKTVRGSFRVTLTAGGEPGEQIYKVWTRDSNGAIDSAAFNIRSAMSFEPSTVGIGDAFKITIVDWEDDEDRPGHRPEVAAVHIGGVQAYVATPFERDGCLDYEGLHFADPKTRIVPFEVKVPKDVPPGEQTVSVFDHEELEHYDSDGRLVSNLQPCDELGQQTSGLNAGKFDFTAKVRRDPKALVEKTVEVVTKSLTVTPSTAVRGQKVTITSTEFTERAGSDDCPNTSFQGDICSITVNGEDVPEDPSRFEVSHNGDFSATVTVPLGAHSGENEVRVLGADGSLGTGSLTVPEPAITLDSPEGQRGSEVVVTGSGFVANAIVQVTYGGADEYVGFEQTDSRGNFELSFPVPLTAAIGRTQKVTAVMQGQGQEGPFTAEADHTPPAAAITTSPDLVIAGDVLTVHGENFPPFAQVRPVEFAGRLVTSLQNASTSRTGAFEMEIRVFPVELGNQTLRVEVSGVVVTHIVEIGSPPLSGPPARVFAELVGAGVLERVWYLDRPTQEWFFYDPDQSFSEFSNLTEVKRSEVYYIQLSAPHRFQGESLVAGLNAIAIR